LDSRVREMLPIIASYKPKARHEAIETIKAFLIPGAQKTKGNGGLLPALGLLLDTQRLSVPAKVLPVPKLVAAGVEVPKKNGENWGPLLSRADFKVNPNHSVELKVVLVYNSRLKQGALKVYDLIRNFVNNHHAKYRLSVKPYAQVEAGDNERHWGSVERYFSDPKLPPNLFIIDFVKPAKALDPAYPVVKHLLAASGFLSQFVNFKTYAHDQPRDQRKSEMILQGVARQILQKCGHRIWWVSIPKGLPLPAMFIGVDVFHAPMVYDPRTKKRGRKASCAAIVIEVIRSADQSQVQIYSKTFRREGGQEYELGDVLKDTIVKAQKILKVKPNAVVVWRDGMGESSFEDKAAQEIDGIRRGLAGGDAVVGTTQKPPTTVPLCYMICQKRIATKFFAKGIAGLQDGDAGAPSGTMVMDIQGMNYTTFYINGRAPPFSTAKPVRFIAVVRDGKLKDVPMGHLTWEQCHNYPNWPGPIKVPAVCQMAHKLAELAGLMVDCGETINAEKYANTLFFL